MAKRIADGFASLVMRDIVMCEEAIANFEVENACKLITRMVNKYQDDLPTLGHTMQYYLFGESGDLKSDLYAIKDRLSVYLVKGDVKEKQDSKDTKVIIENNNTNTNTNTSTNTVIVDVHTLISSAIEDIENDGSLSEAEMSEIIEKLKEMKEIALSDDKRPKKWFKLKGMLNWVSTKGVDIGCKVLPILLKLIEKNPGA